MAATAVPTEVIQFSDGQEARIAQPRVGDSGRELLKAIGQQSGRPVIVLCGTVKRSDKDIEKRLLRLFDHAVMRAAADAGALIVDAGTANGLAEIMGLSVVRNEDRDRLIGIAPRGKVVLPGEEPQGDGLVPLDPHHGRFLLAASDRWGGEVDTLVKFVDSAADGNPVVLILAGGGSGAYEELRRAVRLEWPVFVLQGTNGLADMVAKIHGGDANADTLEIAEAIEDADLRMVTSATGSDELHGLLLGALGDEDMLQMIWSQFAAWDGAANSRQQYFRRIYEAILALGVAATLTALLQTVLISHHVVHEGTLASRLLQLGVVALPIALTAVVAANNRFRDGSKWVAFRQAAESVKQEIFRFRTRTGVYGVRGPDPGPPAGRLAERVGAIAEGLMKTDANEASLAASASSSLPAEGVLEEGDDGFSRLSPDLYLRLRVNNQMKYYARKAREHERELRLTWMAVLAVGVIGSVLAAFGFGLWVALTTSIAAAITAYIQAMRIENSLMQYNQAYSSLSALRDWWEGLGRSGQRDPDRFDDLVDRAERVFESERSGWVRQMTDAMADLRTQRRAQEKDTDRAARSG